MQVSRRRFGHINIFASILCPRDFNFVVRLRIRELFDRPTVLLGETPYPYGPVLYLGTVGPRVSYFIRLIKSRVMESVGGEDVTPEEAKAFADELSELAKKQSLALQSAAYLRACNKTLRPRLCCCSSDPRSVKIPGQSRTRMTPY